MLSRTSRTTSCLDFVFAFPFACCDGFPFEDDLRDRESWKLLVRWERKTESVSVRGRDSRRCNVKRMEQMSYGGFSQKFAQGLQKDAPQQCWRIHGGKESLYV